MMEKKGVRWNAALPGPGSVGDTYSLDIYPAGERLFLGNPHRDAAVLGAAYVGGVIRDRVIFAVALGIETRRIDAEDDDFMHHVVGAILGEFEIRSGVALVVGVAADPDMHVGIGLQDIGDVLQLLLRRRLERSGVGIEQQAVEIEPGIGIHLRVGILDEYQELVLDAVLRNVEHDAVRQRGLDKRPEIRGTVGDGVAGLAGRVAGRMHRVVHRVAAIEEPEQRREQNAAKNYRRPHDAARLRPNFLAYAGYFRGDARRDGGKPGDGKSGGQEAAEPRQFGGQHAAESRRGEAFGADLRRQRAENQRRGRSQDSSGRGRAHTGNFGDFVLNAGEIVTEQHV